MSLKKDLAKEINIIEKEMQELENKRSRSMAALMESLISNNEPQETEMQFFRQYSAEIEVKRENLIELTKQLQSLVD
ncbi:MAG: hypothetical protein J1G04_01790 [Clostridiales bacterium]|nr:hypothetical protein [Clostridiales bacterium]